MIRKHLSGASLNALNHYLQQPEFLKKSNTNKIIFLKDCITKIEREMISLSRNEKTKYKYVKQSTFDKMKSESTREAGPPRLNEKVKQAADRRNCIFISKLEHELRYAIEWKLKTRFCN